MQAMDLSRILNDALEEGFLPLCDLDAALEDDAAYDETVDLLNDNFNVFRVEAPQRDEVPDVKSSRPFPVRPADLESYRHYIRTIKKRRLMTREEEYLFAKRMEFFKRRLVRIVLAADLPEEKADLFLRFDGCPGGSGQAGLCPVCDRIGKCPRGKAGLIRENCRTYNTCRSIFVERNLPLVVILSRPYRTYGVPIMDLIQEGNMALIRAVEKYDWRKQVRFQTYAEFWVRQAVERAIGAAKGIVRVPNYVQQRVRRFKREGKLDPNGHKLAASDLSKALDVTTELAGRIIESGRAHISLDTAFGCGETMRPADLIADSGPVSMTRDEMETMRDKLGEALAVLKEKERTVIRHRFGLAGTEPKTLEQLGLLMKVSRERVRQVQIRALEKLRSTEAAKILKIFCDPESRL
jgi:RNA polymerase primary sigma factor